MNLELVCKQLGVAGAQQLGKLRLISECQLIKQAQPAAAAED